jgi:hypothetical protein
VVDRLLVAIVNRDEARPLRIPALFCFGGLIVLAVVGGDTGVEGWALFTGAGLSILLLNVLFRVGVQGERERAEEDAARDYFAEHGEWPEEDERPRGRQWKLPPGVETLDESGAEASHREPRSGEHVQRRP